jgi:hypothetical protein
VTSAPQHSVQAEVFEKPGGLAVKLPGLFPSDEA